MTTSPHLPALADRCAPRRGVALVAVLCLLLTGLLSVTALAPRASAASPLGQRLADVVSGEVGEVESPLGSNKLPGEPYGNLGLAWCAHFVTWALKASGVDPYGSGRGSFASNVARAWSVKGKVNGYGRMGTARNAQVGDLLIDRYDGSATSGGHISVVVQIGVSGRSDLVVAVGGNESDEVVRSIKDIDTTDRYLVTLAEMRNGSTATAPAGPVSAPTTAPYETYEAPAGWETQTIAASVASGTAAASQRSGSLDVFYLDPSARLRQSYYRGTGVWSAGADFGVPAGGSTGRPTATSWADGRLDVFVRTGSGALAQRYFSAGRWSGWAYPPAGKAGTSPSVASWGPGRLDLFSVTDGKLSHAWYDGSWKAFRVDGRPLPAGVVLSGAPAAVSWDSGRIDVVARATDGRVFQTYYQNGWGPWRHQTATTSLRAAAGDSLGLSSWGPGRLDVFFKATDGFTWHQWFDASAWSPFQNMGTRTPNGPTPVSWAAGRVDLFYRSGDNRLGHQYYKR